jgi:hypothetical protein
VETAILCAPQSGPCTHKLEAQGMRGWTERVYVGRGCQVLYFVKDYTMVLNVILVTPGKGHPGAPEGLPEYSEYLT